MLKYFYKTFLIAVLSGSLLSLQTSVAYAAGTNTTDKNGVITNTQSHNLKKVTDTDMLASLGMLAGGFITGRMLSKYTPATNDVMVAGAAGAAFIAGEILSNMKFKGTIDEMTVEVVKKSDGKVNEEQIQRLSDLKKSYEEAKDTTETKKKLQLAAAAGFGIASAMAGYMAYVEKAAVMSCQTAATTALTTATTCPDVVAAAKTLGADLIPIQVSCKECALEIKAFQSMMVNIEAARISPGKSAIENKKITPMQTNAKAMNTALCSKSLMSPMLMTSVKTSVLATCETALSITSLNQVFSYKPSPDFFTNTSKIFQDRLYTRNIDSDFDFKSMQSINTQSPLFTQQILNFLFPEAQAAWLPLLGLGAATASSFFLITGTLAQEIDLMMFVPFNRSVAFAAFAALAFLASKASDNVIADLDENIKKIDTILADLNRMAKGIKAQNLTQQQIKVATINTGVKDMLQFNKNPNLKTECLQNNSTANCPSTTDQLRSMPGFANLPDSFKDLASQTTTLGDNLSGKNAISGSTLSQAESLGNKQNAINKLLKSREAAFDKLNGGKTNYENEKGKFLNNMNKAVMRALKQKGETATGMMASMGVSPINSSANLKEPSILPNKTQASGNVVDISANGDDEKKKDNSLDLNFSEETSAPVDMSGGTASAKAPEYQIDSNEINGENGPSIFEVLSNRYIKSGYPKLLEEEPTKN